MDGTLQIFVPAGFAVISHRKSCLSAPQLDVVWLQVTYPLDLVRTRLAYGMDSSSSSSSRATSQSQTSSTGLPSTKLGLMLLLMCLFMRPAISVQHCTRGGDWEKSLRKPIINEAPMTFQLLLLRQTGTKQCLWRAAADYQRGLDEHAAHRGLCGAVQRDRTNPLWDPTLRRLEVLCVSEPQAALQIVSLSLFCGA